MSLGWDPEVPAGYQDADIEMRELADAANEAAGYCHLCDRPLPDDLPISGLCRGCEEQEDRENEVHDIGGKE